MGWLSSISKDIRIAQRRDPAVMVVSSAPPRTAVVVGDCHLAGVSSGPEQQGIPRREIGRQR
jgi:hypothetical protein